MRERLTTPRLIVLALAIPMLATAIAFRVWHLANIPGTNGDEAYYGVKSLAILHGLKHGWTTPNGNLYNPFFFGPCILLHRFFAPSFLIMRGIAVVCGLLALLVNYRLCLQVFGWGTAVASTLILAVLPENIAQSRFGWDPSESVLMDTFVVYFSLLVVKEQARSVKWALLGVIAFAAALLVHPTNGFTGPFLLFAVGWRWRHRLSWIYPTSPFTGFKIAVYAVVVLAIATLNGVAQTKMGNVGKTSIDIPRAYGNLFSGVTVYQYIPGSFLPLNTPEWLMMLWTVAPCVVFASVLLVLWRWEIALVQDRILYAGWAAGIVLFFAIAGTQGLSPTNERYGLCLIVPGVLVLCRSASIATESRRVLRYTAFAAGMLACGALLASFYIYYFQFFKETGGNSRPNFHTAAIEPKQAAWDLIRSQAAGREKFVIVSSMYWNSEPLEYLAETDHRAVVVTSKPSIDASDQSELARAVRTGRVWSVEFHGLDGTKETQTYLDGHNIRYSVYPIPDYAGRPVLDIIHWQPASQ